MSVAAHTKKILASYRDEMTAEEIMDFLDMMFEDAWDFDEVYGENQDEEDSDDEWSKYLIIKGGADAKHFNNWFTPPTAQKGEVMFTLKHREGCLLIMAETEKRGWFQFHSNTNIAKIILKILEKTPAIKEFLEQ